MNEYDLIGKTILSTDIDGFGVKIVCTDGTTLDYCASDGGYSSWDITHSTELTPFDVLEIISSAYGGKQIFFQNKDGSIYDRYSNEYITFEEAVRRMAERVGDNGDC